MTKDRNDESLTAEQTKERFESALKRMLSTPHQPHKPIGKKAKSPRQKRASAKRGSA